MKANLNKKIMNKSICVVWGMLVGVILLICMQLYLSDKINIHEMILYLVAGSIVSYSLSFLGCYHVLKQILVNSFDAHQLKYKWGKVDYIVIAGVAIGYLLVIIFKFNIDNIISCVWLFIAIYPINLKTTSIIFYQDYLILDNAIIKTNRINKYSLASTKLHKEKRQKIYIYIKNRTPLKLVYSNEWIEQLETYLNEQGIEKVEE